MTRSLPLVRLGQRTFPEHEYQPAHRDHDRTAYLLRSYAASGPQRHREEAHQLADRHYRTVEQEHGLPDWDARSHYQPRPRRGEHRYDPLGLWLYAALCVIALLAAVLLRGLGG